MITSISKTGLPAAALITLMMLTGGCGKEPPEKAEVIRPVRYQQVFASGGERVRTFSGVSKSGEESRLSFKVPGTIERLAVAVGDQVKAGDLIATLDAGDFQLQAEEAEATLRRYEAQARSADAAYSRIRGLYENDHASLSDLDGARAASETAVAAVRSAEKGLELARNQLAYTRLTAPIDGAIAEVPVEKNENIAARKVVALLTSGSNMEVRVGVPEILIAQIREGSSVTISFDAIPGHRFPAVVTEVGVAAGEMATVYPVTARLDESSPDVRPGMAAEVAFSFASTDRGEHIFVPPAAVGEDREGNFVYIVDGVVEGIGTARRRVVRVGALSGDGLEIEEGVRDGELLVTAGVNKLVDGRRVKMLSRTESAP